MKRIISIAIVGLGLSLGVSSAGAAHEDTLAGTDHQLIGRDGRTISPAAITRKPYLFIYFSAGWCPLCKKFTPQLADFYAQNRQHGDFEVLFVSSDKSPEEMRQYWATGGFPA